MAISLAFPPTSHQGLAGDGGFRRELSREASRSGTVC